MTTQNILQQVVTYQKSHLAYLLNYSCFINESNHRFDNFQNFSGNLGATVTFDLPIRYASQEGLVVTSQPTVQPKQSLTVNQSRNVTYDFTAEQFIFNVEDYMKDFGIGATAELGAVIEANVALNCQTGPYRFYDGVNTPLSSFGQLAKMLQLYKTYGYPHQTIKAFLSDGVIPDITNSGLNQFVMRRNEEMAMSWEVGNWKGVDWFESNLLPIQNAGTVGQNGQVLTVLATNDPTGNNITQITFSGATNSDPDAIKQYDSFQFIDGVSGQPNMRFLTFVGHQPSAAYLQFSSVTDVGATGAGHVTVTINPPLCATQGNQNQNIQYNIVAGMQCNVLPPHRCGMIVGGDSLYLAMPKLPDQTPFPTSNYTDPYTGVSLRLTHGSVLGGNSTKFIQDCIWGSTIPGQFAMKIALPL